MIVDSSALVALLRGEPDAQRYIDAIDKADICKISAGSFLEAAIVINSARDPIASRRFDQFFERADMVIESATEEQARLARAAYRDFGRGSGHPAQLNFGDCFAYALAKDKDEPLLFKGDDFAHTDVEPA